MKFFQSVKLTICFSLLAACLAVATKSDAESYVGIQGGMSLGNKIKGNRADVDTNYPNATGPAPSFIGTKVSEVELNESFSVGAKAGHYFDAIPFLGIEGELNYTKPDFNRQRLDLSNAALPPGFSVLEGKADVHDFSAGVSLMARYPAFKRVMPYVGVGPMLHYYRIRGSGNFNPPTVPGLELPGPGIKQDELGIGVQAKAGVRIAATKRLAVDVEYKFNYSPARFDQVRELENFRGSYNSHQIGLALVYRFGNIKW